MKSCFGTIYPDLSRFESNQTSTSKVFRLRIVSQGMMHQAPQFEADQAEWEDCQRCEFYRSCFDFSNAKLAMRQALSRF